MQHKLRELQIINARARKILEYSIKRRKRRENKGGERKRIKERGRELNKKKERKKRERAQPLHRARGTRPGLGLGGARGPRLPLMVGGGTD